MNNPPINSEVECAAVRQLVRLAFEEDAPYGDLSALYSVPENHRSDAQVIAREPLLFCGEELVPIIFEEFGKDLAYSGLSKDGKLAADGDVLLKLAGNTRALLQLERVLLNFLQRLCGVATYTAEVVRDAHGITILDTRKTMPGWRMLDKYATRSGGAKNHRFSLSDLIMIKNNHVDAHGGDMEATLKDIFSKKPQYLPVQVEVRNLKELQSALKFFPHAVLLDNMKDEVIEKCLALLKKEAPQTLIEVSGGITAQRLRRLSELGVPAVSMGGLTTVARNRDISLRILKT